MMSSLLVPTVSISKSIRVAMSPMVRRSVCFKSLSTAHCGQHVSLLSSSHQKRYSPSIPSIQQHSLYTHRIRSYSSSRVNGEGHSNNGENETLLRQQQQKEKERQMIAVSDAWVRQWVFRHNLCPWAGKVLADKAVRYRVTSLSPLTRQGRRQLWNQVRKEIALLLLPSIQSGGVSVANDEDESDRNQEGGVIVGGSNRVSVDTTLIILSHPLIVKDFEIFLMTHQFIEEMIENADLDGEIQVATFHPKYRFASNSVGDEEDVATDKVDGEDEVENYTNRSPYPMLHLLKVDQVMQAIDSVHGETEKIWKRNIQLMKKMGLSSVKAAQKEIIDSAKQDQYRNDPPKQR